MTARKMGYLLKRKQKATALVHFICGLEAYLLEYNDVFRKEHCSSTPPGLVVTTTSAGIVCHHSTVASVSGPPTRAPFALHASFAPRSSLSSCSLSCCDSPSAASGTAPI